MTTGRLTEQSRPATNVRTLGALVSDNDTTFRVWAPDCDSLQLVIHQTKDVPLEARRLTPDADGYWTGVFDDVRAGALYKYRMNGEEGKTFPDPASRFQPFGVHGPSQVVNPWSYRWHDADWAPTFDALVIYELHVGTFSPPGTFAGVIERIPALVELGINALELMPVADFAGSRNWGYDGVALFAPSRCYGTPDDLRALVDAAHAHGLAIFLDVVYNHFGPDGAYANAFSPYYLSDRHESPWGRGVNLDGSHSGQVRRFFIENAVHWIGEYHVDGLRLDATHALVDDSPRHFLAELTATVRASVARPVYFVAEDHRNLTTLLQPLSRGGYGIDGVWSDDFHHQVRVHTAKDDEGYFADFSGSIADLARTIEQGWFFTGQYSAYLERERGSDPTPLDPRQFVICIQNHDQVGNRADGARLNHSVDPATFRALSALLLLAPETPLLFMGQEWAATTPFQYFTDHHEELGRQVTQGRRQEFRSFSAFVDPAARETIPDPQGASTFEQSKLNWSEAERDPHVRMRRLYSRLLAMRRRHPSMTERRRGSFAVRALDEATLLVDYNGALLVVVRLSGGGGRVEFEAPNEAQVVLTTEDDAFAADAMPIVVEGGAGAKRLARFARPGAIVLAPPDVTPGT